MTAPSPCRRSPATRATAAAASDRHARGRERDQGQRHAAPASATSRPQVRCSAGQSRARKTAGAAASRPKSRGIDRPAEQRAGQAAQLPADEEDQPRSAQNAYRLAGRRRLADGHRGGLVDHEVRGPQPAQAARGAGSPTSARRRTRCGRRAAGRPAIAANGLPPAATTPAKANCDAPENITRLSTMAWATLSPEPTATAPYAIPNAPAYRPIPTAARRIGPRSTVGSSRSVLACVLTRAAGFKGIVSLAPSHRTAPTTVTSRGATSRAGSRLPTGTGLIRQQPQRDAEQQQPAARGDRGQVGRGQEVPDQEADQGQRALDHRDRKGGRHHPDARARRRRRCWRTRPGPP